jgi:hypothetical protein
VPTIFLDGTGTYLMIGWDGIYIRCVVGTYLMIGWDGIYIVPFPLLNFGTLESGPLVLLMCLTLKGEKYHSLTLLYVIKSK